MSIDEVEGVDVGGSTSIASFWELIFVNEDGDGGGGFCKEAFRFLDKSQVKIYSHLPGNKCKWTINIA
jgi:hypothetical protein